MKTNGSWILYGSFLLMFSCGNGEERELRDSVLNAETPAGKADSPSADSNFTGVSDTFKRDSDPSSIDISGEDQISCVLYPDDDLDYDASPTFGDSTNALLGVYLRQHIIYPDSLKEKGVTGVLKLQVSIDKTGKVVYASVRKGLHPVLDEASVTAVLAMPPWRPAMKDGAPVGSNIVLPIVFNADN